MIILDEQLIGYGLQAALARWYRGSVMDITELRPGSVIKDEAIPTLLHLVRQPVFVTINVADFWRRFQPDARFLVACFAVPHTRAEEVSLLLRKLFKLEPFGTQKRRMGKIARISPGEVRYYSLESKKIQTIAFL